MQSVQPYENAFVYKEIISLINKSSLQVEEIKSYLKNNFNYTPNDDMNRTLLVKNDLYFLGIVDNLFVCQPITKPTIDTFSFLNALSEMIVIMIKRKYGLYNIANFVSCKLCCYVEIDKKVPFGFVRQSDNPLATDIFGTPLVQPNLTLYTKVFQFDPQYNILPIGLETMIEKIFVQSSFVQPAFAQPSFVQPSFVQPAFAQSSFAQSSFSQPAFVQPSFTQPAFAQPSLSHPSFAQPAFAQSSLGQNKSVFTQPFGK
jgi:hypothetical protein